MLHLQERCDEFTLLLNGHYGPPAFRFYNNISSYPVRNIYVLRDPNIRPGTTQRGPFLHKPFYPCRVMHEALCTYLTVLAPDAVIHSVGHKDISLDFARVLYAPILFKGMSTFTFWGGLANRGVVYSTGRIRDFGPDWHWSSVPIMNAAAVSKMAGPKVKAAQVDRILAWLMNA